MNTPPLLDLLSELLRGADRRTGGVEVVPVLMDELAADLHVIAAILRHHGAPLVVAEDAIDGVVAGDNGVRQLLSCVLVQPPSPLTVVEMSQGRQAVRFQGVDAGLSVSPGAINFLGTLTGLLSAELMDQTVGVIAYAETSIDIEHRVALWQFLLDTLPEASTRLPKTLIALVGNETIDNEHHCRKGPSLRYAAREGNVLTRRRWDNSRAAIARLAPRNPVIFFLGAGFAASSGLPLGDDLRDDALRRYVADRKGLPADDLARRFHAMVEADGRLLPDELDMSVDDFVDRLTLERVLREEVHQGDHRESETLIDFRGQQPAALAAPGASVLWLRRIIDTDRRLVIVTVNFDELISAENANVKVFASDDEFQQAGNYVTEYLVQGGQVPMLKLHGTAGSLGTIVANVDQTAIGLSAARSEALHALISISPGDYVPLIYVGYSMRDSDVLQVLQQPAFATAFTEQWVSPLPDRFVEQFVNSHRRPLWASAGVSATLHERSITETADTFMEELGRDMGLST